MITCIVRYIALIENDRATGVTRVAFPAKGHSLEVQKNGAVEKALEGESIILKVTDRNGAAVTPGPQGTFPIGGRVVPLSAVTGERSSMRPSSDLIKRNPLKLFARLAQTVLELPGGTFSSQPPKTTSVYADSEWVFGEDADAHAQKLTDTVMWVADYDPQCTYTLMVDGKARATLADGDTLTFENVDPPNKNFPKKGNRVEMRDVKWLYALLKDKPERRPAASTEARPEDQAMLAGGDLPLCPVAENP